MEKIHDEKYYKELGFMCGLEIHQRLATSEKLFCSCSASLEEQQHGPEVTRRQRAVAGELGDIDRSAKFEELKERNFKYVISEGHACLVDIDEEPPHKMNKDALKIALKLAASMSMIVPVELEPMRKEVVDGSNPSAFQRSTLVGLNGFITVNGNKIEVPSMFLEEESAGIISNSDSHAVYDTSRIGIPLIEIDTFPYIKTPTEAKAVALYIGTLLRLTGVVQRGIGSIRQDVNVSISGGSRIEIKGLQELSDMDRFIENEVIRQQKLLEISKLLKSRNASVSSEIKDLTDLFLSSESKMIAASLKASGSVMGFALRNFKGIIGMEVNPSRRLGTEISDYAKMAGVKGIIHSDEDMSKYNISPSEIEAVRKRLGLGSEDAFILITGKRETVLKALSLATERSKMAISMVPPETRAVDNRELFTTRFMRPLPGGSRMYPETDTRPILVTQSMLKEAKHSTISVSEERSKLISELSSEDLADRMMLSPKLQLYRELTESEKSDKQFVANVLLQKFREMQREGVDPETINNAKMKEIFGLFFDGKITKQATEELIKLSAKENEKSITELVKSNALLRKTGKELEALVYSELKDHNLSDKAEISLFVKSFMSKHRLNVDGAELNEIISKISSKHSKK
jgi:glutamyl-tRNA(Gln) amidotransferase subunit E